MTNLYAEVEALEPGTIWNIQGGAPWMRTEFGVIDLCAGGSHREKPIPTIWKSYEYPEPVAIIYQEES